MIGKVRLACTPVVNHWWNVALYVSSRGLTSSLLPHPSGRSFEIELDFLEQDLVVQVTDGGQRRRPLQAETVADFYTAFTGLLTELDVPVHIWTMPVEIPDAIPFQLDQVHGAYDHGQVRRYWRELVEARRVLELFRSRFLGKVSPVHLFWGALDLAVTRFSGREAPTPSMSAPNVGPHVMQEAYSHQLSSCGFWPGPTGRGAFYCYAYPEPAGFQDASIPTEARYDERLGEFVLDYDSVCAAADPDALLLTFLQGTYEAAADRGEWDRQRLERSATRY